MTPQKLVSFSAAVAARPGGGRTVRVSAATENGTMYENRLLTYKAMEYKTAVRVCRFFEKMPPVWAGDIPGYADTVFLWEDGAIKRANMSGKNSLNAFIESMI